MTRLVEAMTILAGLVFTFSLGLLFLAWITVLPTVGLLWSVGVLR